MNDYKYKFTALFFVLFLFPLSGHAQKAVLDRASFCCLYTHQVQTETREHEPATDIYYSILEVGEGIYKYGMLSTYGGAEKYLPAELEELRKEDCLRDEYLWVTQNCPEEGTMTVEDALHPAIFVYTEPMDSMRWDLMPGDTTILDYPCHKAKARYAGREWAVWYTEEIPVPSGPWKFAGLPGLVLLAQDKTGTHAFQAISVFNVDSQPIHRISSQWYTMKDTRRDEFIKTRNKIKCDSRWLKMPYYNDEANMYMAVLRADVRKRLGIRPFISFNMIKYPCREDEGGGLEYIYNAFQPLELY